MSRSSGRVDFLFPIRIILRSIMLLLMGTIFLVPTVLCQSKFGRAIPAGRRRLDEFMLNTWSRWLCRTFGAWPRVEGRPLAGPVVIVANHISFLDIQVMHSAGTMSFVAKAEIDDWPLFGFLARSGGTVFHKRGSHDSAQGAVGQLLAKLRGGGRAAIFPEGGILPGNDIKRFHARMFRLAIEAPCPVQPAMIRYVRKGEPDPRMRSLPGESFLANIVRLLGGPPCRVELKFLEPFEVGEAQRRDLAAQAQEAVEAAYYAPVEG